MTGRSPIDGAGRGAACLGSTVAVETRRLGWATARAPRKRKSCRENPMLRIIVLLISLNNKRCCSAGSKYGRRTSTLPLAIKIDGGGFYINP